MLFLAAALLLPACGCPREAPPAESPRAPVLLVTLDTTRADRIGCYGYPGAKTPMLDALAARGARFAQAWAAAPLTIPSHASLFTGLYPPRHGVRDNGDFRLDAQALTLAERLQAAGWRTHAAVGAFVTQAHWGFGQGFDGYDDALGTSSDRLGWRSERPAQEVVDDALRALGDGADFLWVHLFEPHAPYAPPEPFRSRFAERPYDGEIAAADAALGRLLAALPPDALVVVAGDHGEGLGEGGELAHGLLLGGATLHVPLILAGPGIAPQVVERPVSLVDVVPTLLRLLHLPPDPALDGADLLEPAPRPGVFAETRYGLHHYGWSPLTALLGPAGRVVRGAREEREGAVDDAMLAALDRHARAAPAWAPAPVTLDPAEVAQLQALGYLGAAAPAQGGGDAAGSVDPRDGIRDAQRLAGLDELPPAAQEEALRELLAEQPRFRDARFRLGLLLAGQGRLEEGLQELAALHRAQPDSTAAVAVAGLWMQLQDPEEALTWYREALALDPRSPAARAGEVEALVAAGRPDEAQAQAELLLAEHPDDARALMARAWLALAAGEPADPWIAPLDALLAERPWQPGLLALAARVQAAAGRPERAAELYRAALRVQPFDLATRLELLALFREQGLRVDAWKTLRPLRELQPDEPRWARIEEELLREMGR